MNKPFLKLSGSMNFIDLPKGAEVTDLGEEPMAKLFMSFSRKRRNRCVILAEGGGERVEVGSFAVKNEGDVPRPGFHSYMYVPVAPYKRLSLSQIQVEIYEEPIDDKGNTVLLYEIVKNRLTNESTTILIAKSVHIISRT